jgi:NAD(P)-dependent dehydrogenase (short-subunit alcohol dehydrogenase family)
MGAAMVRDFVAHGAQVIAMDLDEANNAAVAAAAQGPGRAHPVTCDVSVEASVRTAFATAARLMSGIDSLVHAAGIAPAIRTPMYEKTRSEMSPEQLRAHDAALATRIPLGGKLGDAERDFAPVMRFLVTKDASFMTGQTFAIDGGMAMVR